jgi:hypothetical protein
MIKCHECEANLTKKQLKVRVETEADEGGVYVVRHYVCPYCYSEISDRRLRPLGSYLAPSWDEPLRWET